MAEFAELGKLALAVSGTAFSLVGVVASVSWAVGKFTQKIEQKNELLEAQRTQVDRLSIKHDEGMAELRRRCADLEKTVDTEKALREQEQRHSAQLEARAEYDQEVMRRLLDYAFRADCKCETLSKNR